LKEWIVIHQIKALYNQGKGLSIRAIARKLKISRNTVRKYLAMDEETIQKMKANPSRTKILDAHRTYIVHLLKTYPGLSAVKVRQKLLEKHPELSVSIRTVRRYVRDLRQSVPLKQKRYYEPVLEMEPGVQCQVDGGQMRRLMIGGRETTVYFVVFVLSYSRLMYVAVSDKPVDTESFIRMHDQAFWYFGGCPEECVYDQTKLVVLSERFRELSLNERFHAYATAAGFRIRACEGYDPESKGKVEAGVKYVKRNALYGESFADWAELEEYLKDWLKKANSRVHGTTGKVPRKYYEEEERRHMRSYFTPAYLMFGEGQETRKADRTGLIAWRANRYSVPLAYQRTRVGVREEDGFLIISDLESGQEVARHRINPGKGLIIKNTNHYRDREKEIADYEAEVKGHLGRAGEKICALLKKTSPRIYRDQLVGLLKLLKQGGLPEELIKHLCSRQRLTTGLIYDYVEAWRRGAEGFEVNPPKAEESKGLNLSRYQALLMEVGREIH